MDGGGGHDVPHTPPLENFREALIDARGALTLWIEHPSEEHHQAAAEALLQGLVHRWGGS